MLARHGITIRGDIRRERVGPQRLLQPGVAIVAEHVTPLPAILSRIGKNSQNLFAECLLKRLGHERALRKGRSPAVGSWETGREAVLEFCADAGIDVAGMVVSDGSGLSRDNRATARQFAAVLAHTYRHEHRDVFIGALSTAGEDGSLSRRMGDVAGRVLAKTGYMHGVRTLSGYVQTDAGRRLCFSVMFNGFKGSSAPFNRLHDDFCRALTSWE